MQRGGRAQVGPLAHHELTEPLAQFLLDFDLLPELLRDQHGVEDNRRAHGTVGRSRHHAILSHQPEGGASGEILGRAAPLAADGHAAVGAPLRQRLAGILRAGAAADFLEHDAVEPVVVGGLEGDLRPSARRQRGTRGRYRHADVGRPIHEQHHGERLLQAVPPGGVVGRQAEHDLLIHHQTAAPLTPLRRRRECAAALAATSTTRCAAAG